MRKALVIARREYAAMVRTKAFLISVLLMPALMLGLVVLQVFLEGRSDLAERRIAVHDATSELFEELAARAEERNAEIREEEGESAGARYVLEEVKGAIDDEARLEQSERIRAGEIDCLVEIGAGAVDGPGEGRSAEVVFTAQNVAFNKARTWVKEAVSAIVKERRLERMGVDPDAVEEALRPVPFEAVGPYERTARGEARRADRTESVAASILPLVLLLLMFFTVMLSAQPLLQSVIEEKQQHIAEVLLGAVRPFELMAGKLVGNAGIALTILGIYLVGGLVLAVRFVWADLASASVLGWFVVFEILAVLTFGAFFAAVGAACNELRDTQVLVAPVMVIALVPVMLWSEVVGDPMGDLSTALSFVPLTAPFLMMARVAAAGSIPAWQPALSALSSSAVAALFVLGAGRIFRIGILARGKAPGLGQLLRWAVRG